MNCPKCGMEMERILDEKYLVPYYHCIFCGKVQYDSRPSIKVDREKSINYLELVFRKMCDIVNFPFSELNLKNKKYRERTFWSASQKRKFMLWFYKLLKKSKKAQEEIFGRKLKEGEIKRKVQMFTERFGWISEEEYLRLMKEREEERRRKEEERRYREKIEEIMRRTRNYE